MATTKTTFDNAFFGKIAEDIPAGEHTLTFAGISYVMKNNAPVAVNIEVEENYNPIYINLLNPINIRIFDDFLRELGVNERHPDKVNKKADTRFYVRMEANGNFLNPRFKKKFDPNKASK